MSDETTGCADDQIWRNVPTSALRAAADAMTPPAATDAVEVVALRGEIALALTRPVFVDGVSKADRILTIIAREVAAARPFIAAECAAIAEKWRDENKVAAAKARKSGNPACNALADMLEGAQIECHAIAKATGK